MCTAGMHSWSVRLVALLVTVLLTGCGGTPGIAPSKLTQAQLNAIETREVDAGLGETYNAAVSALFDAGYTISVSDRAGGIITGIREIDRQSERIWVSTMIEDTKFAISIQMRKMSPQRTMARVKLSINGEPRVDKETIDEIWTLMQRQVLMSAPPDMGG